MNLDVLAPVLEQGIRYARQNVPWAGTRCYSEITTQHGVRNDLPERNQRHLQQGVMCEVFLNGQFAYSATADLSLEGLKRAFDRALDAARVTHACKVHDFYLEKVRPPALGSYRSPYAQPLDGASAGEVMDCLLAATRAMTGSPLIVHRSAAATLAQTQIRYQSSSGANIHQDFDWVDIGLSATAAEGAQSQSRSWSQTGQWGAEAMVRDTLVFHAQRIAQDAATLLHAPQCPDGMMDLILMPDQMMLQIHESIGHPLELDRILGDERNYAGWSFVQPQDFGTLQYGSALMNVSFDPGQSHELASYAFDDGGIPARKEMLIESGVLRRGLGSLESQARSGLPGVANFRSSGWNRAPIDRMANINLEPGTSSLEALIAQVENGVLMQTNRSWSIDDFRNKFQFGCEHGQRIEEGRLTHVVRNPNYRGVTVDFWNRLAGVGDRARVYGTAFCGKGEPNQLIRVGHASPPCWFRGVQVFGGGAS